MIPNGLEILTHVAGQLAGVLDAARRAYFDPDYRGAPWNESCLGNRLSPAHVVVDEIGNVLHVERKGQTFADEELIITYLPSWFAAVLDNLPARTLPRLRSSEGMLPALAQPSDKDAAAPLEVVAAVKRVGTSRSAHVSVDYRASHGSLILRSGVDPAWFAAQLPPNGAEAIERVHWIAPSLRIVAAPGVSVVPRELYPVVGEFDPWALDFSGGVQTLASTPFWGWFVMDAARRLDDQARHGSRITVTAQQALQVEVERVQNPEAVPGPGAPRRKAGVSELDLRLPAAGRFEEVTRPDGVDLLLLTPAAAAALERARRDIKAAVLSVINSYVQGVSGGLPFDAAIPVKIRVDPASAEDRFAYTVQELSNRDGARFRLAVKRTKHVTVTAGLFYGARGSEQVAQIVDFRDEECDFDAVPFAILDGTEKMKSGRLDPRPLTTEEVADVVLLAIGLVPFPPCQVLSDLNDYATILRYLHDGKDTLGRDMSRLEFALTCAGVLLPEVLEVVAKQAARLIVAGDQPGQRIVRTFAEVAPASVGTPLMGLTEVAQ